MTFHGDKAEDVIGELFTGFLKSMKNLRLYFMYIHILVDKGVGSIYVHI